MDFEGEGRDFGILDGGGVLGGGFYGVCVSAEAAVE